MADPTPDDDTRVDPDAPSDEDAATKGGAETDETTDGTSAVAETAADAETTGGRSRPAGNADPQADVAARRAATTARMDEATKAPKVKASADDPTGTKARRAATGSRAMGKASADDPTGTKARRQAAAGATRVPKPSKRTGGVVDPKAVRSSTARSGNPKKAAAAAESSRYTAPIPRSQIESPVWVPGLMFTLLGLGMVAIFLTYVVWGGKPLTLGVGLALILGGILTATQYR
ncbi:hypothetical protein [Iamia sp.]|uniref:hypothetical protein n=1 Tax=Iamia sp. TaxID=2722710 RepID=UPI002C2D6F9B|nr:hypothetical protein [Iamia sp.]HXH56220.1 hypothetical protein [Iamia sp.]